MTDSRDPARRLRVLLVDRHEVIHLGVEALLLDKDWVEVFIAAFDLEQAADLAARYRPHVAMIDADIEGGQELCRRIQTESATTRLLVLASDPHAVVHARTAGVEGVVPRRWRAESIAEVVRAVGLGMTVFGTIADAEPLLTQREAAILALMADGATNREIGERLSLSPHTIKDHVSLMYRKLDARNRAGAIIRAERLGLIHPVPVEK